MKFLLKNLKKEDRTKEVLRLWRERKISGPSSLNQVRADSEQNFQIAWTSTDATTNPMTTPRQI